MLDAGSVTTETLCDCVLDGCVEIGAVVVKVDNKVAVEDGWEEGLSADCVEREVTVSNKVDCGEVTAFVDEPGRETGDEEEMPPAEALHG